MRRLLTTAVCALAVNAAPAQAHTLSARDAFVVANDYLAAKVVTDYKVYFCGRIYMLDRHRIDCSGWTEHGATRCWYDLVVRDDHTYDPYVAEATIDYCQEQY